MEKWKENKTTILITSIVILLPIIIGLLLWDRLPNEVATHFGGNGEADGWSSKGVAVFGLPVFVLICHLLCCAGTCTDPKNHRVGDKMFGLILWICPMVSWLGALSIYGYELDMGINVKLVMQLFMGAVFVVVGNYLPKCKQNYTVGIKLPWTLHDEENWNHTHRLAGRLWLAGGIIFMLLAFVDFAGTGATFVLFGIMVFVPVVYSFIYYSRHKR